MRNRFRRRSLLLLGAMLGGLLPTFTNLVAPRHVAASSAYETNVQNDSPSVYYRLGESSGTSAADDSGNGVTGTYPASGITYSATGAISGDSDTGITTTNAGPAVSAIDSTMPSGSHALTLETWIKTTADPSSSSGGNSFTMLMLYGTGATAEEVNLTLLSATSFKLGFGNPDNVLFDSPYPLNDGTWHLLDVTFDGSSTAAGYVDGQRVGTGTVPTTPNIVLGGFGLNIDGWSSGYGINASLDESAVYPSAISAAHINTRWQLGAGAGSCPSTPGTGYAGAVAADSPSRFYPLGETSGAVAVDYSGNCQTAEYAPGVTHGTGALLTSTDDSVGSGTAADVKVSAGDGGLPTGSSQRTLEAWVKTTATPPAGGIGDELVAYGTVATSEEEWLTLPSSTSIQAWWGGSGNSFTAPYSLTDGTWHQIAVTFNGSTSVEGYVDGLQVGSSQSPSTTPNTTLGGFGLPMGGWHDGSYALDGSIADTAVYPTALSAKHIAIHYLASGNTPSPKDQLSAAEFGAGAYNPCYKCRLEAVAGDPINTATGDYTDTVTDLSIPGRGLNIDLDRSYDSANASNNGPFGYGWTFNYGMSISPGTSGANQTITQENGSQVPFTYHSGSGTYTAPSHDLATLTYNSGSTTWTFQREGQNSYTFNTSGQLTQETDLNGYTTTLAYVSGNLDTVTDNAGRSISFGWTGSNITSVTDSNVSGNTRTISYGYTSGDLTSVTDVNGGITDMAYSSHRMTLMRRPNYHSNGSLGTAPSTCSSTPVADAVNNHYTSGQVDCQWDPAGKKTTLAYTGSPFTASGGTTTITDPVGNETLDTYQWGLRTSTTTGYGTSDAATTSVEYDPVTLAITAEVDPNGNATTFTLDSNGNVLTKTDPLGRVTTNTWNAFNEPLTSEDGNGVTTTDAYDGNGNLTSTSTPLTGVGGATATNCKSPSTAVAIAAVTCYAHANGTYPGDVTSITDPDGNISYIHYDTNGYPDEVKDPLGHVTGTVRNNDGWITATYTAKAGCTWNSSPPTGCSASYETQLSYVVPGSSPAVTNEFGEVGTVTDPLGHTTKSTWDLDGNQASTTDGNGNTTSFTRDPDDRVTTTTRPDSTTLVTAFNGDGTVHTTTNGASKTLITLGYNHRAQVTSSEDALGNTTYFTLDLDGNVLTTKQPVSGATCTGTKVGCITNTWDADNEVATVSFSDNSSENVTNITHDSDGQTTAMTDGTGTSSWTIDSLHRLTQYENGNGDTVSYGFTSAGTYELKNQPLSITYPNSVGTVDQTWNTDGTMATVEDWNSKTITLGHDTNANLDSITYPSTTNVTDTIGLNDADQVDSISSSNGSTLFSATYTRDSNGQVSSDSSQAANQQDAKYNSLNQLCYAGGSSSNACGSPPASSYPYAFDNADNLTTNNGTTQTFNDAGEIQSSGSSTTTACNASPPTGTTSYCADNKGNRTAAISHSGSTTCDAWDQSNRLTQVETGSGTTCTSPTVTVAYGWTGNGVLASKTVSGTTTHYTDNGAGTMLQEKTGSTVTSYILGPGGIPLEQIVGSTTTYLHHDQVGSIRLITDSAGATGTATTQAFDPYGNSVSTSGSLTSPFGFAGQYLLSDSGLYLMGARVYDPVTSTFMSVDPALAKTMSPTAYVGGDPLNGVDPSGLAQINLPGALCIWIPFTDQSGCGGQVLSPTQGAIALGVVGVIGTGGVACLAGGCEAAAGLLGVGAAVAPEVESSATDEAAGASESAMQDLECPLSGYTRHGINQAISNDGHGVSPTSILQATTDPISVETQAGGTTMYIGTNANVVLNQSGQVVTTWATNHNGWRY
jgi:RHS repeat-associated protein